MEPLVTRTTRSSEVIKILLTLNLNSLFNARQLIGDGVALTDLPVLPQTATFIPPGIDNKMSSKALWPFTNPFGIFRL